MRTMASAASDWLKQDKRRMLHVVYRVGDMQVGGGALPRPRCRSQDEPCGLV